jgi:replicative DNA helicase
MSDDKLAIEAEQALLASVLVEPRDFAKIAHLRAEDFVEPWHQEVWKAILDVFNSGADPHRLAVAPRLPKHIDLYTLKLSRSVVTTLNNEGYAKVVRDMAIRRELKGLLEVCALTADDHTKTSDELIAQVIGDLQRMSKEGAKPALSKQAVAIRIAEGMRKPAKFFTTGLPTFDKAIGGGFFAGKCYGVAARKKVGKTCFAATVSHNMNCYGTKHLYLAGEMSPEEIEQRNMARVLKINSVEFLKRGNTKLPGMVADYALEVPDNMIYEAAAGCTLDDIRRMVARAIVQHGITGFILDYWQLVGGKGRNESEEYHLRNVAQWVADTCRKEGLWALVLAQVNQEGNTRGGEGLKLASDCYFTLHREKDEEGAWLEMEESRYVLYADVGSEQYPGLWLNKHGPYFEDMGTPSRMTARAAE